MIQSNAPLSSKGYPLLGLALVTALGMTSLSVAAQAPVPPNAPVQASPMRPSQVHRAVAERCATQLIPWLKAFINQWGGFFSPLVNEAKNAKAVLKSLGSRTPDAFRDEDFQGIHRATIIILDNAAIEGGFTLDGTTMVPSAFMGRFKNALLAYTSLRHAEARLDGLVKSAQEECEQNHLLEAQRIFAEVMEPWEGYRLESSVPRRMDLLEPGGTRPNAWGGPRREERDPQEEATLRKDLEEGNRVYQAALQAQQHVNLQRVSTFAQDVKALNETTETPLAKLGKVRRIDQILKDPARAKALQINLASMRGGLIAEIIKHVRWLPELAEPQVGTEPEIRDETLQALKRSLLERELYASTINTTILNPGRGYREIDWQVLEEIIKPADPDLYTKVGRNFARFVESEGHWRQIREKNEILQERRRVWETEVDAMFEQIVRTASNVAALETQMLDPRRSLMHASIAKVLEDERKVLKRLPLNERVKKARLEPDFQTKLRRRIHDMEEHNAELSKLSSTLSFDGQLGCITLNAIVGKLREFL